LFFSLQLKQGKLDEAIAQVQEALRISPTFTPSQRNLEKVFIRRNGGQLQ
jgi:hypothetical protein